MTEPDTTDRILRQGQALVRAIKPTGAIERAQVSLLLEAYHRRLRAIVRSAVGRLVEEILSASEPIGEDRLALF